MKSVKSIKSIKCGMALSSIKSLLNRTLKQHGIAGGVEAARVVEAMEQVLVEKWGSIAKSGIKVKFYRDKAIYLACASSVLAQEVRLYEKSLLKELNGKLEGQEVERVRFVA